MKWKSLKKQKPISQKKIWISFFTDGVFTKQEQTSAKIVGKDGDGDYLWHDFVTGEIMNNKRVTVTHWMSLPDNPMLL